MKRFNFRLEALQLLRELRESQAATALSQRRAHQRNLEEALEGAQARSEATRAGLLASTRTRVRLQSHVAALADYDHNLAAEQAADRARQEHQKLVVAAGTVWSEASRDLKIVQKLRDRARELHRLEEARVSQSEWDEAAVRIVTRRISALP